MFFKTRFQRQQLTEPKIVIADIDDEYRGDEEAYNRIINTQSQFKWILYIIFAMGVVFSLPWPKVKPFFPELTILIFIPLTIFFMSKFYINRVKNGFKLIGRMHPEKCVEEDTITVYFQLQYKCIFPFYVAYICDRFFASRKLGSPLTILKNSDFGKDGDLHLKYVIKQDRGYGSFDVGPMELTVCDPFLFFEEKVLLPSTSKLIVWLNPPPEEDVELINSTILNPNGSTRSTKSGSGMDFYGLKEYNPGDDIKAISWLKSASIGKTVIKQFERDSMPNVFIAIHSDRTQLRGLGFGNTMKRIFRIAAAVIQESRNRGIPVKLAIAQEKETTLTEVSSSIPAYGFMTELISKLQAAEPEVAKSLMQTICTETGSNSIILFMSHTLHLDYENIFSGISALIARGVKVILWVMDDSKQLNMSEFQQKEKITPEEFANRVRELGIEFRIIDPKEQFAKDEAYKEATRLMKS